MSVTKNDRREYSKKYYSENKDKWVKYTNNNEWYYNNPERAKDIRAKYYQKNKKDIVRRRVERYNTNIHVRLSGILRGRLKGALARYRDKKYKWKSAIKLLGCDMNFFIKYIEKMFVNGMSWENYGSVWHIDHIRPVISFDLRLKEDQLECFHYTNMQPLLAHDNISKGSKYVTRL